MVDAPMPHAVENIDTVIDVVEILEEIQEQIAERSHVRVVEQVVDFFVRRIEEEIATPMQIVRLTRIQSEPRSILNKKSRGGPNHCLGDAAPPASLLIHETSSAT